MDDVVLCDVGDDGVALLTLNRPDSLERLDVRDAARAVRPAPGLR